MEQHPFINWTKSYDFYYNNEHHNFFVASQKSGHFICVFIYYEENKNKTNNMEPSFFIKTENFIDLTEELVYNKCLAWIETKFKGDYRIEEDKTNRFISWS